MNNKKIRIVAKDNHTAKLYIDGKDMSDYCTGVNLEIVAGECHKLTVTFHPQKTYVELEDVEVTNNADIE